MRIYRDHRFAPPSNSTRRQADPRLDTYALMLIVVDLILLGLFVWKVARLEAAGGSSHHLIIMMALIAVIPSLVGLGLGWYMRGQLYIFALPLLLISVIVFPVINFECASILAKHVLPYAQMEYGTRRTYTVGTAPVTLHVYPGAQEAVPTLVRILQDSHSPDLKQAVVDAGTIGPAAAPAVPALSQIMRDRDRDASYEASQSLLKIGGTGISALIEALSADEDRVRMVAIRALQNAGDAGRPAIPQLEKMWQKEDPSMRAQIDIAVTNLRRHHES